MGSSPSTLTDCLNAAALNDPLYNCSAFDLKKKKGKKTKQKAVGRREGELVFHKWQTLTKGLGEGGCHLRALASLEVTVAACAQIIPTYSSLCQIITKIKWILFFKKKKRRRGSQGFCSKLVSNTNGVS